MIRDRLVSAIIKVLTKPSQKDPTWPYNDLDSLKRHIRTGDVLLVEGDQRVSEVIKYLTQSIWSHAALYVGDELLREAHGYRAMVLRQFGEEANHLVIEAILDKGVVASPLSKYIDSTIRVCRPHALQPEALQTILDTVIAHLGDQYDTKHIFDLARYFFPVSLIPRRYRKAALHLGSSIPTQVICSSLLAEAFYKVRFPILPERLTSEKPSERRSLRERVFGRGRREGTGIFRMPHPTLITARDFDLSPYFESIEFNLIEGAKFDYRQLTWADEPCSTTLQLATPERRKPEFPMRSIFHGQGAHRTWNRMIELMGGKMKIWGRDLMKRGRTVFSWTRSLRWSRTRGVDHRQGSARLNLPISIAQRERSATDQRVRHVTHSGNRVAVRKTIGKICHFNHRTDGARP